MKILVTGANGFLGIHLCQALKKEGHEIKVLVRESSDLSLLTDIYFNKVYGDITDLSSVKKAMKNVDFVFHLAALSSFGEKDKNSYYKVNVEGTRNIVEAAQKNRIKKIVYTSTRGTLGHRKNREPVTENDIATQDDLVDDYLRSKFMAEEIILKAASGGLNSMIVNPTAFIGPLDFKPTPTGKIIMSFLNRRLPAFTDGGINLADVRDVALGHILALKHGKSGEKYILGNADITIKEMLRLISNNSGVPLPKIEIPYYGALLIGAGMEIVSKISKKSPLFTRAKVRTSQLTNFASIKKARQSLGYNPRLINDTIKDVVKWFTQDIKKYENTSS